MNPEQIGQKVKNLGSKLEQVTQQVKSQIEESGVMDRQQLESQFRQLFQTFEKTLQDGLQSAQKRITSKVKLKVKKLDHFSGDLPSYASELASGFDVRAQIPEPIVLQPGERQLVSTGLAFEIPEGYEIQARARSGLAIREGLGLVNAPGTIDADYRGEVKIILVNWGASPVTIAPQDRVAQLVVCPVVQADLHCVEELNDSTRGAGGFGSTGRS